MAETTWLVTRHPGAKEWLQQQGITGTMIDHLDIDCVKPGDTVIGTLPINLAFRVCQLGAIYQHLSLEIPRHLRGVELTSREMEQCGISLERYRVIKIQELE
ncbi:CRISPR-associated protein [Photobacterium aquae]|uniref:CRISPR-associated protein n=1 Tax=Photobacterium aquae TaxID=1195763 RepID=A0A0J1GNV3_9GAMM|nr:CRISPR-associated protein Csx16 [Photobacterium aquae]KLV01453.1 CRISPR-associated protein [Photobacterium aquae]